MSGFAERGSAPHFHLTEKIVEDTRTKFYTAIIFIKIFLFRMSLIKIKAFYWLFSLFNENQYFKLILKTNSDSKNT